MSVATGFRKAKIRDVEVLVPSDGSFTGSFGAKTAKHEFINSDRPLIEYLGKSGETFRFPVIINSNAFPSYNQQKKRLEEALSKPEEMVIIHPTEGRKVVGTVGLISKSESLSEINSCRYEIEFCETTSKIYPQGEGNKSFLLQLIEDTKEAIGKFFEANFNSGSPRLSENFQDSKDFIETATTNINDAVTLINTSGDVLSEYTRNYNNIITNINTIVSTPSKFVEDTQLLWDSVLTITDNALDGFGLNLGLTDSSDATTIGDSTLYTQIRLNEQSIQNFNNANSMINCYNLITDIDFISQEELEKASSLLDDVYNSVIDKFDSDTLYQLQSVRNQARILLDSTKGTLARTITIYTAPTNTTALAYKYYADIERASQIEEINNISNPDLVEGELQILEF